MSYVNRYFATAYRPTPTKIGEHYFDTTKGKPLWWTGSNWVDGVGTIS